jgi:DNA-damage-inducible protein D
VTQLDIYATGESFDSIKNVDADGNETWSARDLMPRLGYGADWRNFADVLSRAKAACANSGHAVQDHFGDATKMVRIGSGASRSVSDYTLTRYGAYLAAMNGDPRKRAVAAAQTYFAAKTHEAEVRAELDELEVARRYVKAIEDKRALELENAQQAQRLAIAEPKAAYVDGFINPEDDATILRVFANQVGTTDPKLRDFLKKHKVLSRRTVEKRWSKTKGRMEPVYEWLPYADFRTWFVPKDQPEAPRLHNGQMRTTLYVTPVGKVGIRRLLMKWPFEPEAA